MIDFLQLQSLKTPQVQSHDDGLEGGLPLDLGSPAPRHAEAVYIQWEANSPSEWAATFKPITTAVHNWHGEIFAYFEQPITNAYTQAVAQEEGQADRRIRPLHSDAVPPTRRLALRVEKKGLAHS